MVKLVKETFRIFSLRATMLPVEAFSARDLDMQGNGFYEKETKQEPAEIHSIMFYMSRIPYPTSGIS